MTACNMNFLYSTIIYYAIMFRKIGYASFGIFYLKNLSKNKITDMCSEY